MAGRLIPSKNFHPIFEEDACSYWRGYGQLDAIDEETREDRALERFSDDPPEAGSSQDEPFLFSNLPNNRFFFLKHFNGQREWEVRSIYRCLEVRHHYIWQHFRQTCNCIILLISDGKMAIGHYKEGNLFAEKQITARRNYDGSEKNPRSFLKEIAAFLKTWQERFEEVELVFVRCTQIHYFALFESLKEVEKEKYRHIPFVTCPPSIEEIQKVYSRLFTYVFHGSVDQTLADLQKERKSSSRAKNIRISEPPKKSTKAQRKAEKQQYPWLDARTAAEIEEAIGRNDGDRLQEILTGKPTEIRNYLNEPKSNGGGTFLHYAVRQEAADSVEVLLEFGADPTLADGQNRVPFEYCKGEKMEEIFIKFREENEENFDWNKAKIPVEKIVPVKEKQREEYDKRAARDKLRSQRRQKLDKRRIKIEVD